MDFDVEKQLNINRFDKEQQEEELDIKLSVTALLL